MSGDGLTKAVAARLVEQRTALTQAGVLRTEIPSNVHARAGVDLAHEDPILLSAFYGFASAHRRDEFTITSGARSRAEQEYLYDNAPLLGLIRGKTVAAPGRSNHDPSATGTGVAEALDVVTGRGAIGTVYGDTELALFGLHDPVPGDPVHVTLMGVNG